MSGSAANAVESSNTEGSWSSSFVGHWRLLRYTWHRQPWRSVGVLCSCLVAGLGAAGITVASAWLIWVLLAPELRVSAAVQAALVVAGVVGIAEWASFTVSRLASRLGLELEACLRQDLVVAAHRHRGPRNPGGVRTQFLTSGYTSELIIISFALVGVRILTGILATALLALFVWWLPLLVLGSLLVARRASRTAFMVSTAAAVGKGRAQDEVDYLVDLALSPRVAKEWRLFGLQRFILEELAAKWRLLARPVTPGRSKVGIPAAVSALLLGVTTCAVVAAVSIFAAEGRLSLPLLVLLIQAMLGGHALTAFSGADLAIARGGPDLAAAIQSAADPAGPADHAVPPAGAAAKPRGDGASKIQGPAIVIGDVKFAYPGAFKPALDCISLSIEAGRCTAIVGPNGAGKSSLLRVIQGFAVPQTGAVYVDGIELADLPPTAWWNHLAIVRQDFVKYPLSLHDNIDVAGVASRAEVESVARRAGLVEVVSGLPMGFDNDLGGGGGIELSGGQWQRVAIARALLAVDRGARVVLLDEPTAALDARAELQVFTDLLAELAGRTVVLVSHRLASVRLADHIIVLDHGRVREQGDHRTLLDHGGYYAKAFRVQAERYQEGEDG